MKRATATDALKAAAFAWAEAEAAGAVPLELDRALHDAARDLWRARHAWERWQSAPKVTRGQAPIG